ncbi:MAG TPA: GntR family transcriptional regulator [Capsulimonadaceae bacterium]
MHTIRTAHAGKQRLSAPYKRIENDIRRKIRRGIWQVGSQIPSRQQLARDYGVDLSTIQKAVSTLLTDGVVATDGTRGTYVSRLPIDEEYSPSENDPPVSPVSDVVLVRSDWETPRMPSAAPQTRVAKKVIGVAGRFAPEISELLVPYILAQAVEDAMGPNKDVALRFFDSFCDRNHSVPISEGAEKLMRERVDGLCVIQPEAADIDPIMNAAHTTGTPVVFLPSEQIADPVPQVYIDHRYDGFQAAKFFLDMGHRDILFIMLGHYSWAHERLAGVRAAVRFAGLPASCVRVFPESPEDILPAKHEKYREPLQEWVRGEITRGSFGGAVIASNDHAALDILDVTDALRMQAGLGFSLMGFDDRPESRRRGLTTLRPPLYDMGREATRLLGVLLASGEIRGESIHSRMISQIVVRTTAS